LVWRKGSIAASLKPDRLLTAKTPGFWETSVFELSSLFTPGEQPSYQVSLTNKSGAPISGFTLGFSGPGCINRESPITGGTIVHQVSNWVEFAPARDFVLEAGLCWDVTIHKLDFLLKHWTDGAVAAMVVLADGSVHPVLTHSSASTANDRPLRRGVVDLPVPVPAPVSASIIPWPKTVTVSGRRTAPDGFAVIAADKIGQEAVASFTGLVDGLFPAEGLVRTRAEGGFPVKLELARGLGAEAYAIDFEPDAATIRASTRTGLVYGLVTLAQTARGARCHPTSFSFPTGGSIEDSPQMGWRGCHLDVSRRFYSSAEVAQFLRIMAWNKLNRFHFHLSDDEAWRVEIDAYPELTGKGAWRGYGMMVPPLLGSGPEPSGGFYTKAAIRGLIALGESLGVEIVPEIDVPGHCYAMLQAMPHLKDPGENGLYHSIQGFPNNCLNPAVAGVYPVIETIFAELCALFPSRYFHVGADEVPEDAWSSSPEAKALLNELEGNDAALLQAHFLGLIQEFLASKGKITGAWEEAAHGGGIAKAKCYLVGWRTPESSRKLAATGYDVVVSPGQAYYLDMANGETWDEPGANWAGWSSPEMTYAFAPGRGWSAAETERLMGIQACIWSEPMSDHGVFDRLVFPRLSAIAETGWTSPGQKSWERFSALSGLMPSLYCVLEQ
jgi:hexosaminidase